jgi:hypothetical protein
MLASVTDHGARTSYLALEPGTPVFDRDGEEIGTLDHVLADPSVDVFDGLIVDTRPLLGGHRFADADQVGDLYERAIFLKVVAADLQEDGRRRGERAGGAAAARVGLDQRSVLSRARRSSVSGIARPAA